MRVFGWLLTALGSVGLLVSMGLLALSMMGSLTNPEQQLMVPLCTGAFFGILILAGRHLRSRSKPLLPILLAS